MECYYFHYLYLNNVPNNLSFISKIFNVFSNVTSFSLVVLTTWKMWISKDETIKILELTKTGVQHSHSSILRLKIIIPVIFVHIFNTMIQFDYFGGITSLFDMSKEIRYFYVSVSEESSWSVVVYGNHTLSDVVQNLFGRLTALSIGHCYGYFYLTHITFLIFSIAMKDVAKEFAIKMVKAKEDVEEGTKEFLHLKRRIHEINDIFGTQLIIYFFASTSYFVTGPDVIMDFQNPSNAPKYSFILFFSTSMLFWIIGAYFHASVQETLRSWLDYQVFQNSHNCRSLETRMQLDSMEKEWTAGCPSLAISTKYFAVTNGFLGTVNNILQKC